MHITFHKISITNIWIQKIIMCLKKIYRCIIKRIINYYVKIWNGNKKDIWIHWNLSIQKFIREKCHYEKDVKNVFFQMFCVFLKIQWQKIQGMKFWKIFWLVIHSIVKSNTFIRKRFLFCKIRCKHFFIWCLFIKSAGTDRNLIHTGYKNTKIYFKL